MNTRFRQQAPQGRAPDDLPAADRLPSRACCCPATAVVRVIMPPTPARPHRTELLLCGHHYRVSAKALAAAGATVIHLPTASESSALLPEIPRPRVPAA